MITHFLGKEEIDGYAADLAHRLTQLGNDFPTQWFALGISGQVFVDRLADYLPEILQQKIRIVRVSSNKDSGRVKFQDSILSSKKPVLLIDSAVHSGKSMLAASKKIAAKGITNIITYSLVLKSTSEIIPNYFGVLIQPTDRCLFDLPQIPNNRLCEQVPFGIFRALNSSDAVRPFIKTGNVEIDNTSFGDLLYEMETKGSLVYVYEHKGVICGVVSFVPHENSILIDLVANNASKQYRGKGVGAALMRWAETWARGNRCASIELWAISDRLDFYKKRQYKAQGRKLVLPNATFNFMRRKLLYNSLVDPMRE